MSRLLAALMPWLTVLALFTLAAIAGAIECAGVSCGR